MATNSLVIKDGNGAASSLSAFSGSYGLIPEHAITGSVNVTASAANPVYVTGNVQISQPVSVEIDLSDNINVTASQSNPVYVTGAVISSVADGLRVSSSVTYPLYVTGNVTVTDFLNTLSVTASQGNPVYVVSEQSKPVFVNNTSSLPLYITSSENSPVTIKTKTATIVNRTKFTNGGMTPQIDWASTGSSNISGTFILANSSSARIGLIFANNTAYDLYVSVGTGSYGSTNGFLLNGTASAPADYSFILYPSGTYSADASFVNAFHSGFFASASNIDVTVNVTTTE